MSPPLLITVATVTLSLLGCAGHVTPLASSSRTQFTVASAHSNPGLEYPSIHVGASPSNPFASPEAHAHFVHYTAYLGTRTKAPTNAKVLNRLQRTNHLRPLRGQVTHRQQ